MGTKRDKKDRYNERRETKVDLRCTIRDIPGGFEAVCLELSVAAQGKTPEECKKRLAEAIEAYITVLRDYPEDTFVFRRVPYYYLRKLLFDWQYRKNNPRKGNPGKNNSTKNYRLEQMMPIGV